MRVCLVGSLTLSDASFIPDLPRNQSWHPKADILSSFPSIIAHCCLLKLPLCKLPKLNYANQGLPEIRGHRGKKARTGSKASGFLKAFAILPPIGREAKVFTILLFIRTNKNQNINNKSLLSIPLKLLKSFICRKIRSRLSMQGTSCS